MSRYDYLLKTLFSELKSNVESQTPVFPYKHLKFSLEALNDYTYYNLRKSKMTSQRPYCTLNFRSARTFLRKLFIQFSGTNLYK